jgi:hypothetical protein
MAGRDRGKTPRERAGRHEGAAQGRAGRHGGTPLRRAGRHCFHCKEWIQDGAAHDCWTTTEGALTRDLPEDLREAYQRIRDTAAEFGEQRVYASLNSIMFSRTACYCFVRPKKSFLELVVFLGRALKAPQVRRAMPASKTKVANLMQIRHRDEIESPVTDWMREAYEQSDALSARGPGRRPPSKAASKSKAVSQVEVHPPRIERKPVRPQRRRQRIG